MSFFTIVNINKGEPAGMQESSRDITTKVMAFLVIA
jgi:hypothetical protein